MTYFLLPVLICAMTNWAASARGWKTVVYITKPLTIILMLGWFTSVAGWQEEALWFGLGLVFSLFGDIFLMLPRERFLPGLSSFLVAHLMYIIGFNVNPHPIHLPSVIVTILVLVIFITLARIFYRHMKNESLLRRTIPILFYLFVLLTMVLSANLCLINRNWSPQSGLLAAIGALLFLISDLLLGWNRFVSPISNRNLKVMATYHLGQLGILVGVLLEFGG